MRPPIEKSAVKREFVGVVSRVNINNHKVDREEGTRVLHLSTDIVSSTNGKESCKSFSIQCPALL